MRARDPDRLASTRYDLLIVGAGIHGLACAYEAATRGLQVAVVDAGDFGGGASFNHQKTAHGGLRSLQSLSVGRAREAIRERRALARIAPWFLRPLPFIVGTYRSLTRSRLALRAAFAMDDWLGRDRNEGVEPELHLPRARLLSKTATTKLFPGVRQERLTGGAQWYDYQMVENDRLTFAVANAADRAGADACNYVEAVAALKSGGRVTGMRVRDVLSGQELDVQAAAVLNAAGSRAGDIMRAFGVNRPFPLLKAMNLVTTRAAADIALAAPDPEGRMLTLVPWRGRAIVGTAQTPIGASGSERVLAGELERFVAQANHAFPALKLHATDVALVHSGLVPAHPGRDGAGDLLPDYALASHGKEGAENAFTVIGAKYTTARAAAERAIDSVARALGKRLAASRTATTTLPGAAIADHEALAIETARRLNVELALPVIRHLIGRYAEASAEIVRLIAERPESAAPVGPGTATIAAEVPYVIRHECAVRLSDMVLRRTTLGAAGHPGAEALQTCASIAARELGWSPDRLREEIDAVERVYRLG